MSRAILVCWHKYTPFGDEFYAPILDFFLSQMEKFEDEYDMIYLIDSTWNIDPDKIDGMKATIVKVDPSLRYYDAYKQVLPQVKEDLVLFMDNDMVVYKPGMIKRTFGLLGDNNDLTDFKYYDQDIKGNSINYDVVSIIDQIGEYKTDKLKNGNKFCPYWFGTRKDLLMKYLDVDWGPDMPYCETLGHLTESMLKDGAKVYEWEEDKSNFLFDGTKDGKKSKNLGYYHIRAGSTPAYLLATEKYGNVDTYNHYLLNQPISEILRQLAWYTYMGGDPQTIIADLHISPLAWFDYMDKFREYYGLK